MDVMHHVSNPALLCNFYPVDKQLHVCVETWMFVKEMIIITIPTETWNLFKC